jgi:hypothetical protein
MDENWLNADPNDDFNPEDHDIEMDELAKMYAVEDMKESQELWAKQKAEIFYRDFETLDVDKSITAVLRLINTSEVNLNDVNVMLDNMITIFEKSEEYEKCNVCLQIKNGVNAKV